MKHEAGMSCPQCGAKTQVIDSRRMDTGRIRRRRVCVSCKGRFSTIEAPMAAFVERNSVVVH